MKNLRPAAFALTLLCIPLLNCGGGSATSAASKPAPWTLVWSDEFNAANGSLPDSTKWTYDIGGKGWGNSELEYYTNRPINASIQNGNLVIQELKETYTGSDGVTRNYTSARLKSQNLFQQTQGRFEARIKLPAGQGMWPAFWMLGDNIDRAGWPACGEIDIMENIGSEPSTVHGSAHGPGYTGGTGVGSQYSLPSGQPLPADFHLYAVEWESNVIRYYLDSTLYETITPASLPAGSPWVFDHPFFLLLNVAVGGDWPGSPDATTVFPQTMLVDYVRVYKRASK